MSSYVNCRSRIFIHKEAHLSVDIGLHSLVSVVEALVDLAAGASGVADLHGIDVGEPVVQIYGTAKGSDDGVPGRIVAYESLNIESIDEGFNLRLVKEVRL